MMDGFDVIIIGAGASGLMCALTAAERGRRVLVLEHTRTPGSKIRISGGGRCNVTNRSVSAENYVSENPHFCKSALNRFTPDDIITLLKKHRIPLEERDHGQIFSRTSADGIVSMLLQICSEAGVTLVTGARIISVNRDTGFTVRTVSAAYQAPSLAVATGGLSYPRLGATDFGYRIAARFGLEIVPLRPGLVPLILPETDRPRLSSLAGISLTAEAETGGIQFTDSLLFTHTGISGPLALQMSNYWRPGNALHINLLPGIDIMEKIGIWRKERPKARLSTLVGSLVTKRVTAALLDGRLQDKQIIHCTGKECAVVADLFTGWRITPAGTAGYEKAEVTGGGVSTREFSSKTCASRRIPGLYFVGEVLDVTGWLGGYNLQWAWASGYCAGCFV